VAVPYI